MRNGTERGGEQSEKRWTAESGEGGDVDGWNSGDKKR